jgi:hypothetical protein
MYAGSYPDDVEGVLLIDSSLPTDAEVDRMIPGDMRAAVIEEQQANGERVDFYTSREQAAALVDSVPDIPIPTSQPAQWIFHRSGRCDGCGS